MSELAREYIEELNEVVNKAFFDARTAILLHNSLRVKWGEGRRQRSYKSNIKKVDTFNYNKIYIRELKEIFR